jgi:hypothetical protein
MDKLKSYLKELGGSEELVSAISEELTRYGTDLKTQYDKEFKVKLQKAKAVCESAVQKEKAALARKVSVFLESKLEAIERAAEKQRLQEETEATGKLKGLRALLEDVQLDENGNSRELQTAQKQIARLTKAFKTLKEERDTAVRKANSANDVALKVLQQNRILEGKVKASSVLAEGRGKPKTKSTGSKKASSKTLSEERKPRKRRLAENRQRPAGSKTTRQQPASSEVRSTTGGDRRIADIAASIDDD